MIERSQLTGRTRPFPLATVLRAVARTMTRPGANLPEPRPFPADYINDTSADLTTLAEFPSMILELQTGRIAGIAAWASALDVLRVTVYPGSHRTTISVVGRTSLGPVVAVNDAVSDWPLEAEGSREITADELAVVAAGVRSAETLAGAR